MPVHHPAFVTHRLGALRPEGPGGCAMTTRVRDELVGGPAARIVRGDAPLYYGKRVFLSFRVATLSGNEVF